MLMLIQHNFLCEFIVERTYRIDEIIFTYESTLGHSMATITFVASFYYIESNIFNNVFDFNISAKVNTEFCQSCLAFIKSPLNISIEFNLIFKKRTSLSHTHPLRYEACLNFCNVVQCAHRSKCRLNHHNSSIFYSKLTYLR